MPAYDSGFKIAARASGRELAEAAGLSCMRWRPIVSEVQVPERFADRAFRATYQGERCVVYFEAYTHWRKNALWNVQAKAGMLSEREKLPTVAVLYILRRRGYEDLDGEFHLKVGDRATQKLWYLPVPVWRLAPADWWEASPGLMALYPLTQHGRPPLEAVGYAAAAIRGTVPDPGLQADLLTTLAYFGTMAYPGVNIFRFIGSDLMRESKLFRQLFSEERQELRREAVANVLETRFGTEAAQTLSPLLEEITDETHLIRLLRLAAECVSPEEFQARLAQGRTRR
jgi:hypothetical protein